MAGCPAIVLPSGIQLSGTPTYKGAYRNGKQYHYSPAVSRGIPIREQRQITAINEDAEKRKAWIRSTVAI